MASHVRVISRQDIANKASTKLKLVSAPGFGLDLPTLAWWLDCPQSQMEFSRVGPIELVHGGAWARSQMLGSLRWPYLGQCVIHGRAIGLRLGLPGPVPMRGLKNWAESFALLEALDPQGPAMGQRLRHSINRGRDQNCC